MNKQTILIILLFGALVFVYFHKDSGYSQRLRTIEEAYRDSIELTQRKYDSIILTKDREAYMAFKKAQEGANRMEVEAILWKKKYEAEKKRKTGIVSNRAYDSLLNSLYPR